MKEILHTPSKKYKLKTFNILVVLYLSVFFFGHLYAGCSGTTATYVPVDPPLPTLNCPSYSNSIGSTPNACGNQTYNLVVPNTGCNSQIYFTVSGNDNSSCSWYVESILSGSTFSYNSTGLVGPLDPNVHGPVFDLIVDNEDNANGVVTVYQN